MLVHRATALAGASLLSFALLALPAQAKTFPTKLFLSQDGIALSKFPSHSSLTHTIEVDRTIGTIAASWTATSDQPWLSVTPNGTTGGTLSVTADPAGLTKNQAYAANVTVTTVDADFSDTETLHVGFWVGAKDPATVEFPLAVTGIATNPVSPIAYVSDGGRSIVEYNVYSGKRVGSFKNVAKAAGTMEPSSDGATLFVADTANSKIVAVDTASGTVIKRYASSVYWNMAYARPYGRPALFISGGALMAYPSGKHLLDGLPTEALAPTPDGKSLFSVDIGISPGTLTSRSITLQHDALVMTTNGSSLIAGENCVDLAVSHDGARAYPACGAPYEFDVYDGSFEQTQTLAAAPYPNNAEVDLNDNFVGGINGLYQTYDVYAYDPNGNSLGNVPTTDTSQSGQQDATMKVSGDGTRVISVAQFSPQYLLFRSLP